MANQHQIARKKDADQRIQVKTERGGIYKHENESTKRNYRTAAAY